MSGCSAGAQLATLAGVTNGSRRHEGKGQWRKTSSDVQAVISMDGIATLSRSLILRMRKSAFRRRGELPVNAKWLGGLYKDSPENWKEASALLWITPKSAPACFINSGLPRYSDGRDEPVAVYDSIGIYTERHRIPVDVHTFRFFHPWFETTAERAVGFLDRVFKGEKVAPRFKLTDHGVANDSTVVQTAAIQRVIDKAETMGWWRRIIVPPGTFLSGASIFQTGHHFASGGRQR